MKKISIYVTNKYYRPANYYRIVQYAKDFPNVNVYSITPSFWYNLAVKVRKRHKIIRKPIKKISYKITIHRLKKFLKKDIEEKPDYIIIQKGLMRFGTKQSVFRDILEILENASLIWDFDDNMLLNGEILQKEYDFLCEHSKYIVTTGEILKNTLPEQYRDKVVILPTSDRTMPVNDAELKQVNKNRKEEMRTSIKLIWLATSANIPDLERVLDILDEAAKELKEKQNKQLVLNVVCDQGINRRLKYLKIKNIKWTRKKGLREVRNANIGIMPLKETEYSKGKGGFKLIQYISTGLPIIASNTGFNKTLFKKDIGFLIDEKENLQGWKDAILELSTSEEKWDMCSKNAYDVWKNNFNAEHNLKVWKKLLNI